MLGRWQTCGYLPGMIERSRGSLFLIGVLAAACAATTPPPKTPATLTAPVGGVAKAPAGPSVGPPVTLLPAATARPFQMATVSIGSVDRLLANGVKLVGSAVPIPMTPAGLRDMLMSEAGLAPEVAVNLDLASPGGAAVVALDDKGRSGVVLAIPTKGPAEADKLIAAMGKPVMTSGPLTMLANAAGKSQGWVYRAGSVVVLGDEVDAMARGAMLALEARRASADDATVTLYPEAIARAHGTDVKSAIAAFLEQMRQLQATANPMMATDNSLSESMGMMLAMIGDAERIEIGLSLDPARGLILRGRLMSRPGTPLEAAARDVRPFAIDPAILGGRGDLVMVGALSMGPFWHQVFSLCRGRLAADKEKGAPAALAYYDAFVAALGDQSSGMVTSEKEAPYLTGAFSTTLKDAPSAAKVGAALGRMDSAAMSALMRAQLAGSASMFDWSAKRESVGKAKALHFKISVKKGGPFDVEAMRHWFGSGFDVYQAVVGARVVVTGGRDARGRLAAVASGKKVAPPTKTATLTEAEAGAKGRDAFYYFDLLPVARVVYKLLPSSGLKGVDPKADVSSVIPASAGPIPVVFTGGGDGVGKVWSTDLTITTAAFSSIGALVTARMMGAAAAK
jgi:hypothetical protein